MVSFIWFDGFWTLRNLYIVIAAKGYSVAARIILFHCYLRLLNADSRIAPSDEIEFRPVFCRTQCDNRASKSPTPNTRRPYACNIYPK